MEKRETILVRFATALNQALHEKFGEIPSTSQFAGMFNALTRPEDYITRETARKWLKGLAYPEVSRLHVLTQWLGISPTDILAAKQPEKASAATKGVAMPVRLAQQTLDALSAHIAVIDAEGVICQVNQSWSEFAKGNGASASLQFGVGLNYLKACDASRAKRDSTAKAMATGIRAVLKGSLQEFALKYPCHSPTERRWFVARTTAFEHAGKRYAVVSHESVSEENWHKLDFPQPTAP